ncbi:MAG: hypothetical protein E7436_08480 [Ruminococcaceae bacterium]|nr:hypothetical protein [Oscillospiraceae bacterium]
MRAKHEVFRGAMLGIAVGDAMGNTVDRLSLEQIRLDYGPNGLLGYDLVNGCAEVTSYTQIAAYAANGLLLGLTRGQTDKLVGYTGLALKEWARFQQYVGSGRNYCWLSKVPEIRRRRCMDTMILDALGRPLGTPENPSTRSRLPSNLTAVFPLALLSGSLGFTPEETDRLGAETIALTHGDPETFLAGAALTHGICLLLKDPQMTVEDLLDHTVAAIQEQFGRDYPQTANLWELMQLARVMGQNQRFSPVEAMEHLRCQTAAEVLAGVLYACITCGDDFDTALITAVNHSGRSAAVGAITGGLLGIKMGAMALPEFYLESLESAYTLVELADDLSRGAPVDVMSRLFDDEWDQKYIHCG